MLCPNDPNDFMVSIGIDKATTALDHVIVASCDVRPQLFNGGSVFGVRVEFVAQSTSLEIMKRDRQSLKMERNINIVDRGHVFRVLITFFRLHRRLELPGTGRTELGLYLGNSLVVCLSVFHIWQIWGEVCLRVLNHPILKGREYRSEERRVGKECRSRWSP